MLAVVSTCAHQQSLFQDRFGGGGVTLCLSPGHHWRVKRTHEAGWREGHGWRKGKERDAGTCTCPQ